MFDRDRLARAALALTLSTALLGLGACDDDPPPPPPPDYMILEDSPNELKTSVAGGVFQRPVRARRAGVDTPPFPARVTLQPLPAGGGIATAFTDAATGTSPFSSTLQITVPNGIAPGRYPIEVTGVAPPIADKRENTYTVVVYGPNDGGAYVEISPSEVVLQPGQSQIVTVSVTRLNGFNGAVTLTYPAPPSTLPAGVTVTRATADNFGAPVVFNFPAGAGGATKQFNLTAGDAAAGMQIVEIEVATGAGAARKTDRAAHIVQVR